MGVLFELWIHRGLLGLYYAYIVNVFTGQRSEARFGEFCASDFE